MRELLVVSLARLAQGAIIAELVAFRVLVPLLGLFMLFRIVESGNPWLIGVFAVLMLLGLAGMYLRMFVLDGRPFIWWRELLLLAVSVAAVLVVHRFERLMP
jgi:hypothetical protein